MQCQFIGQTYGGMALEYVSADDAVRIRVVLDFSRNRLQFDPLHGLGFVPNREDKSGLRHEIGLLEFQRCILTNGFLEIWDPKNGTRLGRTEPYMRVLDLVADRPALACLVEPMQRARAELMAAFNQLHKMMLDAVRADPVCRRLMTVTGVGPVTALTFRATVDVPARFARSRTVGAHFGLTPRKWQSGEIDRMGRISKCGDVMMQTALYDAAHSMLTRTTRWSWLKAWAMQVAKRRGQERALRPGQAVRQAEKGCLAPAPATGLETHPQSLKSAGAD